jgi:hypothetical protein
VIDRHPVIAPFHQRLEHRLGDDLLVSGTGPAGTATFGRVGAVGVKLLLKWATHDPPRLI